VHPEGVRQAIAEGGDGELRSLVTSDARLDAVDRLDVYANAYFYRILEVIEQELPALRRALGEDAFHDLVTSYLVVHPSRQPSIRWVARDVPAFLAAHEAVASLRRRFPWSPDLAALEWAMSECFDEANAKYLARGDLASLAADEWSELRLALVPASRRVDLAWPVGQLRLAWREEDAAGVSPASQPAAVSLAPQRARLVVWRRDDRVSQRALADEEADALDAISGGLSFGALCERVAETLGDAAAPAAAAAWLARWVDDGLLTRTA